MTHLKHFIYGIIIGIANIIPGVSGGTMAVILNVYDKILFAISIKNWKKNIDFLVVLGVGMFFGVIAFSRIVTYFYEQHNVITCFCFIGLIIGSIPMIYHRARYENRVEPKNWIPFCFAFLFMLAVTIINQMLAEKEAVFDVNTLDLPWLLIWIFIAVFISTVAMILPGISGSFVMLLLGVYMIVMKAISQFDLLLLSATALGVLFGGLTGIKLIKILLREHPQALYMGILGLVVGSVFTIYPGFRPGGEGVAAVIGLIVCAAASWYFGKNQQH